MTAKSPLSSDTLLSALGILAGVGAFVFDQWAAKGALVLLALTLIVYVGRRHGSRPLMRYPIAIAMIFTFAFFPWNGVWADFRKDYPRATWLEFVTWSRFHWALAILCSVVLLWGWRPVWNFRRRVIFQWRRTVESEVWIDRATALEIIKKSKWGVSRKPGGGFFDSILFVQKPQFLAQYERFCQMTLDGFAEANKQYIQGVDDKVEYREDKLRKFLREAYDDDVRKQFGEIPYKTV